MKRRTKTVIAALIAIICLACLGVAFLGADDSAVEPAVPRTDLAPEHRFSVVPLSTNPGTSRPDHETHVSAPRLLPTRVIMDLANPPQWTEPLVIPTESPKRPNPDIMPEVHVDPRRLP